MEDFCWEEQISPDTHYRLQRKYSGLQVGAAKRLKALEIENSKLKQLLAEAVLAIDGFSGWHTMKKRSSPVFSTLQRQLVHDRSCPELAF